MLFEERRALEDFADKSLREVIDDVEHLVDLHTERRNGMRKIRDILDGGSAAAAALLGGGYDDDTAPVANLIHSGLTRLAQKLARPPSLKVEPPPKLDSPTARDKAERRERIVRGYDEGAKLDLTLPQVARWLPGYGFAVYTIDDGFDHTGNPYPHATIRDPFEAYPSEWGIQQQPSRIAFVREIAVDKLARLYPEHAGDLAKSGGVVSFDERGRWTGATHRSETVTVAEYLDEAGTWLVVQERELLLSFTPNPIRPIPPFQIMKRFAFNKLIGHYDHATGLMSAQAKMNLLTLIAMEDAVFAPIFIAGELAQGNEVTLGRDAVNRLTQGSSVERLGSSVPPQLFQEIDRLERQLRVTSGYSVIDDSQSPNSFVTGRGLDNLLSGVDNEVREYQTVIRRSLEDLDAKRMMWDEKAYGDTRKPVYGQVEGAEGTEMYTPSSAIGSNWSTTRKYGVMAGFDEPQKIVTGLQLMQSKVIDTLTMQEELDGIDDITEVRKRIAQEEAESTLNQVLLAAAQQGDQRALMAAIEMMAEGDVKQTLKKFFTPEEPQPSEQQQAALAAQQAPSGPPPDSTTILSRLFGSGETQVGAQTVGRVA